MHDIEPFCNWRHLYKPECDELSPFYDVQYNLNEYSNKIYNFLIHPLWDNMDSETLYIKILYTDYEKQFAIIELFGEWNDAISNDIMHLKRNVIDVLIHEGIRYFILIGENVLNFHASDDCYYEEWLDDLEYEGWIVLINFRDYVLNEMKNACLDKYLLWSELLNHAQWRKTTPNILFQLIHDYIKKSHLLNK